MKNTTKLYILDKNGKHYNTLCSTLYYTSEEKNLQRHLDLAAKYPDKYKFLDLETAKIVIEHNEFVVEAMNDDELLRALMAN